MADCSSRNLSDTLQKEREKSYDLEICVREFENKISLIRNGVPVGVFDTPGIDIIHKEKLTLNTVAITEDVRFNDIVNYLVQDKILQAEHVETLNSYKCNRDSMSALLLHYMFGSKAYQCFRQALRSVGYEHIVKRLDDTVVNKDHIDLSRDAGLSARNQSIDDKELEGSSGKADSNDELTIKLDASFKENQEMRERIKEQERQIKDLTSTVKVHSEKIAELQDRISDQNKRHKDAINQLERRVKERLEGLDEQVGNDITNLCRVVETLKQSQYERQQIIARMRTEMEVDSESVKKSIEEDVASVEEMMERMKIELTQNTEVTEILAGNTR